MRTNFAFYHIISLLIAGGMQFVYADEILKPRSHKDLENPTFEYAKEVIGAEVAWKNRSALDRDFPEVRYLSDAELNLWILKNTAFIGSRQSQLNGIRNSEIPLGSKLKPAFRPPNYARSAVVEVFSPSDDTKIIGLIDIKGFGHGALSGDRINNHLNSMSTMDELRVKGHSDGLMSLGEAIAEASRQQAAQYLFDFIGLEFETVETYAIIKLPFNILKPSEQIPAALYLRQSNRGRERDLNITEDIYTDRSGGRQKTENLTAIDFGGVIITSPLVGELSESGNTKDPQTSKAWRWAHEVAKAYVRQDNPDRSSIYRHFYDILNSFHTQCMESENFKYKEARRKVLRRYIQYLYSKGLSYEAIKALYFKKRSVIKAQFKIIEKALSDEKPDVRVRAANALYGRSDPESLRLIEIALSDENFYVRVIAVDILSRRSDPESLRLIEIALSDREAYVRTSAAKALSGRSDPEAIKLIKDLLVKSFGGKSEYKIFTNSSLSCY